jgi:hypothetical protein
VILAGCKRRKEKAMADIIRFKIEGLAGRSKPFEQTLKDEGRRMRDEGGRQETEVRIRVHPRSSAVNNPVPFSAFSVPLW